MNVILIALDTLRADHLGCYGYRYPTSPTLDAFAAEAVVFENYFAPTIPTHPSFTSLFTGMDAFGHQVVNVRGTHELVPEIKVLPEMLREHGFTTAAADNLRRWFSRRRVDRRQSLGDLDSWSAGGRDRRRIGQHRCVRLSRCSAARGPIPCLRSHRAKYE